MLQRFRDAVADLHESFLQGLNDGAETRATTNPSRLKQLKNRLPIWNWLSFCTSHTSNRCLSLSPSPKNGEVERMNGTKVCAAPKDTLRVVLANNLRSQPSAHQRGQAHGPYLQNHGTESYGSGDGCAATTHCPGTYSRAELAPHVGSQLGHFQYDEPSPSFSSYRNVDIGHAEHPTIDVDYGHRHTQSRYGYYVCDGGNPYTGVPLDEPPFSSVYDSPTSFHSHSTRNGRGLHAAQPYAYDVHSDEHHAPSYVPPLSRRSDFAVVPPPKRRMNVVTKMGTQQNTVARRQHVVRSQQHSEENALWHSATSSGADHRGENGRQHHIPYTWRSDAMPGLQHRENSGTRTEQYVGSTDGCTQVQYVEQLCHDDDATHRRQMRSADDADFNMAYHGSREHRQTSPTQAGLHEQQQREQQQRNREGDTPPTERTRVGEYEQQEEEQQHALRGPHKKKSTSSRDGRSSKKKERYKEVIKNRNATPPHRATQQQPQQKRAANGSTDRSLPPSQQRASNNYLATGSSEINTPAHGTNRSMDRKFPPSQQHASNNYFATGSAGKNTPAHGTNWSTDRSLSPPQQFSSDTDPATGSAGENHAHDKNGSTDRNLSALHQRVADNGSSALSTGRNAPTHGTSPGRLGARRIRTPEHSGALAPNAPGEKGGSHTRTPSAKGRGQPVESLGHSHFAQKSRQPGKGPACFSSHENPCRPSGASSCQVVVQSEKTGVMRKACIKRDGATETNELVRCTAESMQQSRQTTQTSLQHIPAINSTAHTDSSPLLERRTSGPEERQSSGPKERPMMSTTPFSPDMQSEAAMADGTTDVVKVPLGGYGLFEPGNSNSARNFLQEMPLSNKDRNVGPDQLDVSPRILGALSKPGSIAQFNPTSRGAKQREAAKQMPTKADPPMTTGRKLGAGSIRQCVHQHTVTEPHFGES
eukprot:GEMP01006805.1.p1 GENE.GEMP01006805.1~~GEMP01006805.1.p1  ORF type:complete len:929 (+),score=162.74 GEMP01006805.1:173-2959(+)